MPSKLKKQAQTLRGLGESEYDEDLPRLTGGRPLLKLES